MCLASPVGCYIHADQGTCQWQAAAPLSLHSCRWQDRRSLCKCKVHLLSSRTCCAVTHWRIHQGGCSAVHCVTWCHWVLQMLQKGCPNLWQLTFISELEERHSTASVQVTPYWTPQNHRTSQVGTLPSPGCYSHVCNKHRHVCYFKNKTLGLVGIS